MQFLRTPWVIAKPILSARPNDRAIFGTACRDMAIQLKTSTELATEDGSGAGQAGKALANKSFSQIGPADFPLLIERIKRLLHKMEFRPSRRYRRVRRSHWIDVEQSISSSFRHGGVMFHLGFRKRRRRQPKILILCDVSASMIRHVRFTLPLLFGMSRGSKSTAAYICAGDIEPVTSYFRKETDFQKATEWLLKETLQVGRGTCLSHAFQKLYQQRETPIDSSTCLLIVSDAETMEPTETVTALRLLSKRAKQIVWLNTEPRRQWKQSSINSQLQRYCRMEECTTLAKTIRILKNI